MIRLLSYNVRSLRDEKQAVAVVIRDCRPDIVCVQEAPRFLRWRSKCAALARESGLLFITGGRPAGAMVLLGALRVDVRQQRDVKLSKTRRLHQRGLAIAVVDVAGDRYTVASMHLGLDGAERQRHVPEVLDILAGYPAPLVLAGDVNERPGGPAWSALGARLQDCYAVAPDGPGDTYSSGRPHKRIDAVFADQRLEVVSCRAVEHPLVAVASDHRPVLAELRPR